jgi:tRNA-dependent cyclodipeptide synthase
MKDFNPRSQKVLQKFLHYPPASGPYKVVLKSRSNWRDFPACRLQISVGRPKHEGDKFFALTEWAAARFDKVWFIVSDTLQRHNLALEMGITLDEAYKVAQIKGREWLRDNARAINNIPAHRRIITLWDDWMTHPDYAATRIDINALYANNIFFRASVDEKAEEFCTRRAEDGSIIHDRTDKAMATSVRYILEEVAAFAIMLREQPVLDIYPGEWFKAMFELLAVTTHNPLLSGFAGSAFLSVDYKTNKSFTDQENQDPLILP